MLQIRRSFRRTIARAVILKNPRRPNFGNSNFGGQQYELTVGIDLSMYEVIRSQFAFRNYIHKRRTELMKLWDYKFEGNRITFLFSAINYWKLLHFSVKTIRNCIEKHNCSAN